MKFFLLKHLYIFVYTKCNYYGDWIKEKGVAICSCNDGLRPVIMKIERTDEDDQ